MRKDAKKNLEKVAKELLIDPLRTQREIAKNTGQSLGSVNDKVNKLEQSGVIEKSTDVIRIAKADLEHLEMIQGIELDHLKEYANKANKGEFFKPSDLHSLSSIAEKKQKRYSTLMGENTDDKGGEKLSEEKKALIKNLLDNQ